MATYKREIKSLGSGVVRDSLKLTELDMYGSKRLGVLNADTVLQKSLGNYIVWPKQDCLQTGSVAVTYRLKIPRGGSYRWMGTKSYELSNHLGNVLATVSDRKVDSMPTIIPPDSMVMQYKPAIRTASDYYAFGASKPGRNWSMTKYRFGFNGKETDGQTGYQNYGMRMYDVLTGRFISVDPISKEYPWYTPYQHSGNNPIKFVDIDGLEPGEPGYGGFMGGLSLTSPKAAEIERKTIKSPEFIRGAAPGAIAGASVGFGVILAPAIAHWIASKALWFITNPIAQRTAVATTALVVGLFDESGQVQLPGGFDDEGRAIRLSVNKWMNSNAAAMAKKLGAKIGKNELPRFEKSKEGFQMATEMVEKTLSTPSASVEIKETSRGKLNVIDVYSEATKMTVRIDQNTGKFVTFIEGKTSAIDQTIKKAEFSKKSK